MRFNSFRALGLATVVVFWSGAASGQLAPVSGKVTLKRSDGSIVAVARAQVDIYRTDIRWEAHTTTNAGGEYLFAGVPFIGTFTIAVSAAGAKPDFASNIRVTQRPTNDFQLQAGDGSRLTIDQIKAAATPSVRPPAGTTPLESAEAHAVRERLERETRAIEESNRKITEANDIVDRTFKTGNDAFNSKNYDAAIKAYDEGIAAREEPALYSNKSIALRMRGAERYNSVVSSNDQAVKSAGFEWAKKDWLAAAEAGKRALDILKAMPLPTDEAEKTRYEHNKIAAIGSYAEAMRLVGTKVDKSRGEEAFRAYTDYAALETDPIKRSQRRTDAARILFDADQFDRAMVEFRKILSAEPQNYEAELYIGLGLFNTGDKSKFQEAADHLAKFAEKAPESNPLKADARSILDFLKTQENIAPRRPTARKP